MQSEPQRQKKNISNSKNSDKALKKFGAAVAFQERGQESIMQQNNNCPLFDVFSHKVFRYFILEYVKMIPRSEVSSIPRTESLLRVHEI